MLLKLSILAFVGALIGYLTNVIAIKLLFRPLEPKTIFKFQGLIPKRKADIAKNIGEVVSEELVKVEELIDRFIEAMDKEQIKAVAGEKIKAAIISKLPPFIPSSMVVGYVDAFINESGDDFLNEMTELIIHKATTEVQIDKIVEEKILSYDLLKIESIIIGLAKKELKHIEYLGGVIGFVIGVVQGLIILAI